MADRNQETKEAKGGAEAAPAAAPAQASGGAKAWLPLIITVLTMPVLAFTTTKFVLMPKIEHALSPDGAASKGESASEGGKEGKEGKEGKSSGKEGGSKSSKITVPMSKMLVNVAGTMGTRYLMTSITLVGATVDFKAKIEDSKDQLLDLATGVLSSKTISDLEKPGARNVIRAELLTVFNNALGGPLVQEIYITELAIQ